MAMRALLVPTLFSAGLLAACSTPEAPLPRPMPIPAEMQVSYRCDNGETVQMRFFPQQGIGVLVRGGQNQELQGTATPPGFTYSGGQTSLRVSENRLQMQMTIGMMASTTCTAI